MSGRRTSIVSLLAVPAALLWAAQPDYFPLHAGNQWVYRSAGPRGESTLTLEITRAGQFPGRDYWLRMDEEGTLWAYDPERRQEEVWYAFGKPEGEEYRTALPGSPSRAVIASRRALYKGPVGESDCALEIRYPGVLEAGIQQELFLPYIGMVHRREGAGGSAAVTYDLIYSRTGGVTVLSQPELSVSLALDRPIYYVNLMPPVDPARVVPVMTARITLRNTSSLPVELVWPSGQRYDFVIRNDKGEIVWRWSEGRAFILLFGTETFTGERNYTELIRLGTADGRPLPQGAYLLEAWLSTQPRLYSAAAGFQIQHVH